MRLLAAEMGVSAMTPYRYFRDRKKIVSRIRARPFTRLADRLERALAIPGTLPERSAAVRFAYVQFALKEQACYRLTFDFAQSQAQSAPELVEAEARTHAAIIDHVRMMVDQGYCEGDPKTIGHDFWASLHGLVMLPLADKLDGDFDTVLGERRRILKDAYRASA